MKTTTPYKICPKALLSDQKGLTLLELLIALALFGLIVLIMGSALRTSTKAVRTGLTQMDSVHRARVITEIITQELKSAFILSKPTSAEKLVLFRGEPNKISFVTIAPMRTGPTLYSGLKEVSFSVQENLGFGLRGLILRENLIPHGDLFEGETGYETLLDPTVVEMRCLYLVPVEETEEGNQEERWVEKWEGDKPPLAIKLELSFQSFEGEPLIEIPAFSIAIPLEQTLKITF
jgi:prepilin-type N-terminal cleavage/methylation domain-containing protein